MDQVHLSEVSPYMAALLQRTYEDETIRCPHCNARQSMETYFECVTYYGEEDSKACKCDSCGRPFWVDEIVTRVFITTKIEKEAESEEKGKRMDGDSNPRLAGDSKSC